MTHVRRMSPELAAMLARPRNQVDHTFVPLQRQILETIATRMTRQRKRRNRPDGTVDPDTISANGRLKTIAGRP